MLLDRHLPLFCGSSLKMLVFGLALDQKPSFLAGSSGRTASGRNSVFQSDAVSSQHFGENRQSWHLLPVVDITQRVRLPQNIEKIPIPSPKQGEQWGKRERHLPWRAFFLERTDVRATIRLLPASPAAQVGAAVVRRIACMAAVRSTQPALLQPQKLVEISTSEARFPPVRTGSVWR